METLYRKVAVRDVEKIKKAYGEFWNRFTDFEKEFALTENHVQPACNKLYSEMVKSELFHLQPLRPKSLESLSKLQKHRELWKGQTDEWLFERLTRELSQKVETIHGLLDEKTQLKSDKEELLEALEKCKKSLLWVSENCPIPIIINDGDDDDQIEHIGYRLQEIESLIQKHKQ